MFIRALKIAIKNFLIAILNFMITPSGVITQNSILLIRLDAIGDYVLFRNFIEQLKNSKKYKGYSITLLGNSAWKDLSEELDADFINDFIWLDREKFSKNFLYRYKKLQEITAKGYEVVINPSYSREYVFADDIVKQVVANEKIGCIGDLSNISEERRKKSNNYYTQLLKFEGKIVFEFIRNKLIFEKLLDTQLALDKPSIELQTYSPPILNRYAALFIGANASYRQWDIQKFSEIAEYLQSKYQYNIVLRGGRGDKNISVTFRSLFQGDYTDLVALTSLPELLHIIEKSELLISNETSAPHFAVALNVSRIIVISNGNHYGRFTPYPETVYQRYHCVYPHEVNKVESVEERVKLFGKGSSLDINTISATDVMKVIDSFNLNQF